MKNNIQRPNKAATISIRQTTHMMMGATNHCRVRMLGANLAPLGMSTTPQSHPDAADLHVESSGAGYDEYEDQSHDHPDDHAYDEDYDEDPRPRRRGGFIFVAAVFGLALLGTAGAFAYRAPFADSIVPSLLSIIKAESGPIKIIPASTASQGSVSPQADADNARSSERLVRREERQVDVPPPVSTAPQPVSTAPIFPDSAPAPEPGAASVSPPTWRSLRLARDSPAARLTERQSSGRSRRTATHTSFADDAGTEKDPHYLDADG